MELRFQGQILCQKWEALAGGRDFPRPPSCSGTNAFIHFQAKIFIFGLFSPNRSEVACGKPQTALVQSASLGAHWFPALCKAPVSYRKTAQRERSEPQLQGPDKAVLYGFALQQVSFRRKVAQVFCNRVSKNGPRRTNKPCISQLSPGYASVTTTPKSPWLTTVKACSLFLLHVGCRPVAGVLHVSFMWNSGWRSSPLRSPYSRGKNSNDRATCKFLMLLLGNDISYFYSVSVWVPRSRFQNKDSSTSLFGSFRKYQ